MNSPLDALARRAQRDPFFLGHLLAAYAGSDDLDDPALAEELGCRPEDLPDLRLCRAPREDPDGFRADVQALADHFGLTWLGLGQVVRRAQALLRLRRECPATAGLLLAARDADDAEVPGHERPRVD